MVQPHQQSPTSPMDTSPVWLLAGHLLWGAQSLPALVLPPP